MGNIQMTFGDYVRRARRDKKMSTGQLAAAVDTTQSHISTLENSYGMPHKTTIEKLNKALNVNLFDYVSPEKR